MCNEGNALRILNTLKNKKIQKYDYAFKCMVKKDFLQDEEDDNNFVDEVRQTFFNFLKPFLCNLPDFYKDTSKMNDQDIVFGNYFDQT